MRVLIADDSALIRDDLTHVLSARGFEVAGAVSDLPSLMATVPVAQPDVALIDIRMPPTFTDEGLTGATAIRTRFPSVGVLVLSQHVNADYALTLLTAGPARTGYLLKDRITDIDILVLAIERVGRGETVVDPELVDLLIARPATRSRLEELTAREREILALLAEGLTDRGIASRLWLTPTVETHVRHILTKLDLCGQPAQPAVAGRPRLSQRTRRAHRKTASTQAGRLPLRPPRSMAQSRRRRTSAA